MGWRRRRTAAVIGFTASAHFRGLSRAASTQTRCTRALRSSGIPRPRIGGLGIRDRLGHHPAAGRRSHSSRIFRRCAGLDRDDLRLGCPSGSVDPLGETRQAARIPCLLDSALLPFESAQCALRRSERALPDRGRAMIQDSTLHLVVALIGALALVTLALAVFLPQAASGRHCSESRTENEPELSLLAARVPISEIRDGCIVRRDGSFCAGWECSGIATQFASAERLEAVSSALDALIKGIRHPEIGLQFRYVIDYETSRVLEARKALVQRNREEHHRLAAEFHQILETYRVGLEAIAPVRRLSEPQLVELVYHALNPTDRQLPTTEKQSAALMNTDWFEGVRLLDLGGILKAVVTLSELPEATFASLLRPLTALDFSSEVVLNVRVPDQAAKTRELRVLLKKSLAFQLRKDGSRRRDFQAAALEKDTVDTLASAITSSQRIVEIELAAVVSTSAVARSSAEREKAEQELAQRVESVLQAFGQINGARGYREETALLPSFIAFLPGVHGVRKTNREFTILSSQAADFVPIETPWTGTHDGKQAFLTRARERTCLRFDPSSRELSNGNILVTGKTGSGKSFLIKQLLLQLQVLNPRIAIVTKGADYRALVELLGGQYREISLRTNLVKNTWDLQGNSGEPDSAQIAGVASLAAQMAGKNGSVVSVTLTFLQTGVRLT